MPQDGVGIGTVIAGRFEITGLIPGGGMANVFRATDLQYGRPAAVKIMHARLARDPEFRARFENEAFLSNRASHQHILPVWASGEDQGWFYIATPLADTDLAGLLDRFPHGLPPERALDIIGQVAWALDFAHEQGVLHRDVKPENVLIAQNPDPSLRDHVWLADFGIAKDTGATSHLTGVQMPMTPATAAPEQIRGGKLDGRADQYALTCTLFAALTGDGPFAGYATNELLHAHLGEPVPSIAKRNPQLPAALDPVIAKGMAKTPGARYRTCLELVAAARAAAGLSRAQPDTAPDGDRTQFDRPTPRPPGAPAPDDTIVDRPSAPWYRRTGSLAAAGGVLAALLITTIVLAASDSGSPGDSGDPTPARTSQPDRTATPDDTDPTAEPTDTATAEPTPEDTPAPGLYPAADVSELEAHVPYQGCTELDFDTELEFTDTKPDGTRAALSCDADGGRRAYYLLMGSTGEVASTFTAMVGAGTQDKCNATSSTGTVAWKDSEGKERGDFNCLSLEFEDGATQYAVAWTAPELDVVAIVVSEKSTDDAYDAWNASGPLF